MDAKMKKASSSSGLTSTLRPSRHEITEPLKLACIRKLLSKLWHFKNEIQHNPAANPKSIEKKDLAFLKMNPYVVSEKSDGVRYLLLLGTYPDECIEKSYAKQKQFSVLIDRGNRAFQVQLYAIEPFFAGSLFDGELVCGKYEERHIYLVFDIVAYQGDTSIQKENYIRRHEVITNTFLQSEQTEEMLTLDTKHWIQKAKDYALGDSKIVSVGDEYGLSFHSKPCFQLRHLAVLKRTIPTLPHCSDGLIFTPINEEVRSSGRSSIFKWKEEHTVDFLLKAKVISDSDWSLSLFHVENGCHQNSCREGLTTQNGSKIKVVLENDQNLETLLSAYEESGQHTIEVIVECQCFIRTAAAAVAMAGTSTGPTTLSCRMVRLRTDKKAPNNLQTILRTLQNIQEQITFQELTMAFLNC